MTTIQAEGIAHAIAYAETIGLEYEAIATTQASAVIAHLWQRFEAEFRQGDRVDRIYEDFLTALIGLKPSEDEPDNERIKAVATAIEGYISTDRIAPDGFHCRVWAAATAAIVAMEEHERS